MKIYTKTGDEGKTSLWGGQRVDKDSIRVTAYGTVDELNALLGIIRTNRVSPDLDSLLERIQHELFILGSDLANPGEHTRIARISSVYTAQLEREIDQFEEQLEPLRQFILPGGSVAAAWLHMARTTCRRAERYVVSLSKLEHVNPEALSYLNRLSDWLFIFARLANKHAGVQDVLWISPEQ